jgi:hypothetical protein
MIRDKNAITGAIFGTGRCGSTWFGSVINSHPEVAYRFEPLLRLRRIEKYRLLISNIEHQGFGDGRLGQLRAALLPARPELEIPPFFRKRNRRNLGIAALYPLARGFRPMSALFRAIYSPSDTAPLVFKETGAHDFMVRLLEETTTPVIYLVRHPVAVSDSSARGQERGVMPTGRQEVLVDILRDNANELSLKFGGRVPHMSLLERNALLWRMDVERALRAGMAAGSRFLPILYEQACREPLKQFTRVFAHFGLDVPDQTAAFLQSLLSIDQERSEHSSFFSVARNPALTADRWRKTVPQADVDMVMAIVGDSDAYAFGRQTWDP